MNNEQFYIAGFWRFQKTLLVVSIFIMLAAMMTIDASLLPIHWNIYGEADQFANKYLALGFWPIIIAALMLLMVFIPKLEKRKNNLKQSKKATSFVLGGVSLLIFMCQMIAILVVLGLITSFVHWVVTLISILIIVMGNFLTKLQSNYSIGIRTKWTLSDDRVWAKTHRFASLVFILIGMLSLTSIFWMPTQWLFINVVVFVFGTLICVPYSYVIYKKLNK
ncbi:MAG: SdpI family protein [Saccharospirillaceae bacterium]|nr:SdpI family protein [Pseudomonadales bacterium]NRB77911.1 SdpI family protein [Saccharospirillaceae bacterium]